MGEEGRGEEGEGEMARRDCNDEYCDDRFPASFPFGGSKRGEEARSNSSNCSSGEEKVGDESMFGL